MNKQKLKEEIEFFLATTRGPDVARGIDQLIEQICLEHRKALRPWCVSLAQIGIGIIKGAEDTLWVTNHETIVERIFNTLAIDISDDPEADLKEFITFGADLWHEKHLAQKRNEPVQLELNLKSTT